MLTMPTDDTMRRAVEAGRDAMINSSYLVQKYGLTAVDVDFSWFDQMAEAAIRAALPIIQTEIDLAIEAKKATFLSPEYATGQPLSSMMERFACDVVGRSIRARLAEMLGEK